jgi:hypothetical protein
MSSLEHHILDFRAYTVGYSELYIMINAPNDALQSDRPMVEKGSRDYLLANHAKPYKIHGPLELISKWRMMTTS